LDPLAVPTWHVALALIAAGLIAILARQRDLLAPGGVIAATLLGPALVATGGWWLGLILIAFFLSAALLPEPDRAGPTRTWQQVLANGGPALAFATASLLTAREPLLIGAAATIAAAAADTWATEIGRAFGGTPYSVRTRRRVPAGTSGAISAAGTLASIAGGVAIAGIALLAAPLAPTDDLPTFGTAAVIAVTGSLGSAIDTVLGATFQARFRCETCGTIRESGTDHQPGHLMRPVAGIPWLTNSAVNLLSSLGAGVTAVTLASMPY
jgi:uncharacterized protein (TIGR00297 family)